MGILDFRKRDSFSARMGIISVDEEIQKDSMDDNLRTDLWNVFQMVYLNEDATWIKYCNFKNFIQIIWINYFRLSLDSLDDFYKNTYNKIREIFFSFEWYEVYDFIEYVSGIDCPANKEQFKEVCNKIFEKNLSGFRFIGDKITPIINKDEIEEIQQSLDESQKRKLEGVYIHLADSLKKISDRKNPDYRNSIKESISAVESMVKLITKKEKATLSEALKIINESISIHSALKEGFNKIYGYTGDEDGIRHSIMEEKEINFEDAKYMLVSCSAFINYLIVKADKAKIELTS